MSENISDTNQAQALNKTDVSGSAGIQCCGIFPTNDCEHCGYIKSIIDKTELKNYQWISALKGNMPLEQNLLITDLAGINRTGNFWKNEEGNICLLINATSCYDEYIVTNEKLYGYFWLKEVFQTDVAAYKNRIRVLENMNFKYREKLGISNEPIDALGLVSPLE